MMRVESEDDLIHTVGRIGIGGLKKAITILTITIHSIHKIKTNMRLKTLEQNSVIKNALLSWPKWRRLVHNEKLSGANGLLISALLMNRFHKAIEVLGGMKRVFFLILLKPGYTRIDITYREAVDIWMNILHGGSRRSEVRISIK